MAIERCNACDKLVDLDNDVDGAWTDNNTYFCSRCIEKYGMAADENNWSIIVDLGDFIATSKPEVK